MVVNLIRLLLLTSLINSIYYTLGCRCDFREKPPLEYAISCGFYKCNPFEQWCDFVVKGCIDCQRYCMTAIRRVIFKKRCANECKMYTMLLINCNETSYNDQVRKSRAYSNKTTTVATIVNGCSSGLYKDLACLVNRATHIFALYTLINLFTQVIRD